MNDIVIVAAARTAVGKFGGSLAKTPAPELGAAVIADLVARQPRPLEQVGDDRRAQLGRGNLGERAAEFADGGTGGGDDDDVGGHAGLLRMNEGGVSVRRTVARRVTRIKPFV